MSPVIIGDATLYLGDCRTILPTLPADSVHCVVTSPPYWGLRDYGIGSDSHGLEPTIDAYVANEVEIFRAVRRVLREDGVLFLNLGDSYAANRGYQVRDNKHVEVGNDMSRSLTDGLKPKDLCMIPARVALALQADGWWLRSEIIWAKPNPMPESVRDRPTSAHEKIFLLSKSARYWYDGDAVREPYNEFSLSRYDSSMMGVAPQARQPNGDVSRREREKGIRDPNPLGRNLRNVWTFATEPFPGAHFATFPTELARRCILAGCPMGGTVLDPFGGSGTVAAVAALHDRGNVSIEANPAYLEMASERVREAYRQPRLFPDTPAKAVQETML